LVEGEAEDQPNEKLEGEDDEEDDISNEDRIVNKYVFSEVNVCPQESPLSRFEAN